MSKTARIIAPSVGIGALFLLAPAPGAFAAGPPAANDTPHHAAPGHAAPSPHEPPAGEAPPKGSPAAGLDFFGNHLDRYHWNRTLIGFTRAVQDPYDWAVYHFVPTNIETAARTISPTHAPEVDGDTWVPTPAKEAPPGEGHGPPSHAGQPLHSPVNPVAGVDYLGKWAKKPNPAELVPAVRETARRTITPTESRPPNTVDKWQDKRPADRSGSAPTLVPGEAAALPAQASTAVGKIAGGAVDTLAGGNEDKLLPIGGLLPNGGK